MGTEAMEEHIFYKDDDIFITSTRLVDEDETFAISELVSVRKIEGKRQIPYIILGVAVLFLVVWIGSEIMKNKSSGTLIVSGLFFLISLLSYFFQTVHHHLKLTFSSGDSKVIVSQDVEEIRNMYKAISDAIIFRG